MNLCPFGIESAQPELLQSPRSKERLALWANLSGSACLGRLLGCSFTLTTMLFSRFPLCGSEGWGRSGLEQHGDRLARSRASASAYPGYPRLARGRPPREGALAFPRARGRLAIAYQGLAARASSQEAAPTMLDSRSRALVAPRRWFAKRFLDMALSGEITVTAGPECGNTAR